MTGPIALRGRVITPFEDLEDATVLVEEGRIAGVSRGAQANSGERQLGGDGFIVAPGFIDLQVNGLAGADTSEGRQAIERIAERLPQFGVTAFLPTLVSRPFAEMLEFVAAVSKARSKGARILGAHLEGPFLNRDFAGVHGKEFLLEPTEAHLWPLLHLQPGLRMVTLAPELPGALGAIPRLRSRGVVVSAGHTGATYEEAIAAIDNGLSFATHVFNAMRPFSPREPGAVAALLTDRRVAIGLITDGVHLHDATVQVAVRLCGADRVAFTTDQTAAAAGPPGTYHLATSELISDGQAVRSPEGKIAGGVATMDQLVRRVAPKAADLASLMKMTSTTAARVLGEQDRLGMIAPGRLADLVLLDQDLQVRATLVEGRVVYEGSGSNR